MLVFARFRRAQGRLSEFDPRADGSEAELDCRQTGDVQRCKRELTRSPYRARKSRLPSGFPIAKSLARERFVHGVWELCSAFSVEQTWKDVFPSRAAPSTWSLVARQEARKAPPRGYGVN